jgi:pyridoxal phosphate enzyme (YggS family)
MGISAEVAAIEERIKGKARLVAVSKKQSDDKILEAYNSGFKRFGENYVQELTGKHERLPKDIEWHMIGHLQTNKVKYLAPFVSVIHSVDSLKLLREIDKQALKNSRKISVLLQVHIAEEDTKTGMSEAELDEVLSFSRDNPWTNVLIEGLMGMSTFTTDKSLIRKEFSNLKEIFEKAKSKYPSLQLNELSMGMSSDWPLAVEEGSTLIRVGSAIFGNRL